MTVIKSCLFSLSQSGNLNKLAKKLGPKLGIHSFIAGTNLVELETNIYRLNNRGVAVTIDNLGEFVYYEKDASEATSRILDVIDRIYLKGLNGHISIKLTQIGLDVDDRICLNNATKIIDYANQKNIFVNIDMEDFNHIESSWNIINELTAKYSNIGTVIQAALYRAESDVKQNKKMKLRIVKGAYKESANISFQMKKEIDNNFLKLTKIHLLDGAFTSIATHDHNIIREIIYFIEENDISTSKFEFQMLYGFRTNLQDTLVEKGYNVCVYMPFGKEWYGYFMRRIAERPQNINLLLKQTFNKFFTKAY